MDTGILRTIWKNLLRKVREHSHTGSKEGLEAMVSNVFNHSFCELFTERPQAGNASRRNTDKVPVMELSSGTMSPVKAGSGSLQVKGDTCGNFSV